MLFRSISFEGRVTAYEYDAQDRLSRAIFYHNQTDFDQLRPVAEMAYTYDAFGRVIREVDSLNGTTTTTYNENGQISQKSSPGGTINYEYDVLTGEISRTWTGTNSAAPITDVRNTYDDLGRLETVSTHHRAGAALATHAHNILVTLSIKYIILKL